MPTFAEKYQFHFFNVFLDTFSQTSVKGLVNYVSTHI